MRVLSTLLFLMSLFSSHAFGEVIKSRDGSYSFNLYVTHSDTSVLNRGMRFSSHTAIERVSCSDAYGCQIGLRPQIVQSKNQIQEMLRLSTEFGLPAPNLQFLPENEGEVLIVAAVVDSKSARELFDQLPGNKDVRSMSLARERFRLECRRMEVNSRVAHGCTAVGIFPTKAAQPAILTLASWPAS